MMPINVIRTLYKVLFRVGGSCRGGVGHVGVGWVMQGWGGSCRGGVGWGGSCRGGVGHAGVGGSCRGGVGCVM